MKLASLVLGSFFVLLGAACSANVDSSAPAEEISATEAALKGGCHWDCPKCHPGSPCPLRPCQLVCPNKAVPCGDTVCKHGDVCCNDSCGICTPPDGFCTDQYCGPAPTCTVDADCQLTADYCTGCDCRALGPGESLPECSGPGVRCFADPCQGHTAACVGGQCVLQ